MTFRILNATRETVVAAAAAEAETFVSRFVGLMGRKDLATGEALHIEPCNSIHMFFMRFPIDAVFLDRDRRVVRRIDVIRPWRISPIVKGARSVLELPAGTAEASQTQEGDQLRFER